MVKCGIIGAGIMGQLHVKACAQFSGSEPVAVCDVDETRAQKVAKEFGIQEVYTDYTEMLKKADLDAVHIATPDFLHRDPVVKSLQAGKDVLVEKPMATTLEDAQAIANAAKESKGMLMVNFSNRWFPPHQNTKRAVENGELGEVRHIYARLSDTIYVPTQMLSSWASKSSPTAFLLPHMVDIARWFLGSEAKEVYARKTEGLLKQKGIDTHDTLVAVVAFENGATACFETCWILPDSLPTLVDHYVEVIGTKGTVYTDMKDNCLQKFAAKAEYPRCFSWTTLNNKGIGFFYDSVYHFLECVMDRSIKPINDQEDGYANTEIIVAMLRSAEEKRPVKLPLRDL